MRNVGADGGRRAHRCEGALARGVPILALLALSGCVRGPQSTFAGAGTEASSVEGLFWWMLWGGVAIWIVVLGVGVYASRPRPAAHDEIVGKRMILWGGVVFPTVTLAILLGFGLALMPPFRGPAEGRAIAVSGERFWWRVAYDVEPGQTGVARGLPQGGIESANEIVLPVNTRTEILLGSPDVIHSFWVPAIAGKVDAIPGRVNRIVLEPTKTGVFNGVCAEFCGDAHAQMAFRVRVVTPEEYAAEVARQAAPAVLTGTRGQELFLANGCGACHSVRGTQAQGRVGPDLTHVGSRRTIAAGVLDNTPENIAQFVRATNHVKQGVEMPAYPMLGDDELNAIADWLGALQ